MKSRAVEVTVLVACLLNACESGPTAEEWVIETCDKISAALQVDPEDRDGAVTFGAAVNSATKAARDNDSRDPDLERMKAFVRALSDSSRRLYSAEAEGRLGDANESLESVIEYLETLDGDFCAPAGAPLDG